MQKFLKQSYALSNVDISTLNTEKVTNLSEFFRGCGNTNNIDLSKWKTPNLLDTSYMF